MLFRIAATVGIGGMVACLLCGTVYIWIRSEFQDKLNEPVHIPPVIIVIAAKWMKGANFWQRIIAGGAGVAIAVILTFGGIGGMAYAGANSGMAFQAGFPVALLALRFGSPIGFAATVLLLRRARRSTLFTGKFSSPMRGQCDSPISSRRWPAPVGTWPTGSTNSIPLLSGCALPTARRSTGIRFRSPADNQLDGFGRRGHRDRACGPVRDGTSLHRSGD